MGLYSSVTECEAGRFVRSVHLLYPCVASSCLQVLPTRPWHLFVCRVAGPGIVPGEWRHLVQLAGTELPLGLRLPLVVDHAGEATFVPLGRCQPPKRRAGRMQDTTVLRYGCCLMWNFSAAVARAHSLLHGPGPHLSFVCSDCRCHG